jgi:hypothetical protein
MIRAIIFGGMLLLWCAMEVPGAVGQSTADAYFHRGAQAYVAGNTAAARRAVDQGLEVAPSDPRLIALREKLRRDGRSEGGQDSTSSSSGTESQQDANSASDEATSGEDEPSESGTEEQSQPGAEDRSTGTSQASSSQRPADASERADTMRRRGEGRPVDTLSRAQAERLLQALEGQERQLLRRHRTQDAEPQRVEKDW